MSKSASIGLIETIGLTAAIEAADAAVKSANVRLLGYELTKGGGMVTVKFEGDVGAVKAALDAAVAAAERVSTVYSKHVIPRPHDELEKILNREKKEKQIEESKQEEQDEEQQEILELEEEEAPPVQDEAEEKVEELESSSDVEEITEETDQVEEQTSEWTEEDPTSEEEEVEIDKSNSENDDSEICNICHDPACPRRKGDLRSKCIHNQ